MHLVVFDIDGTLTDTNALDGECYWKAVCEVFGLAEPQPDWSGFRHVTDAGIAADICLHHLGREPRNEEMEALENCLTTLLEIALVGKVPVAHQIPGAAEMLSLLSSSPEVAVALATGGLRSSAELKLQRAGLAWQGLPLASSTDAVSREEILRTGARRAAKKYATRFTSFTYVGDGVWDVRAAAALGWRFIGIGSGKEAANLRQAGAAIVTPHYRPAKAFFELLLDNPVRVA
jgi:phosphoglycolate phosphatase-like HAD superfamily hydrolase